MDFSKVLIRCSSLSKIMAEPMAGRGITATQLARLNELETKYTEFHSGIGKKNLTDKQMIEWKDLVNKRDNPPPPELSLTAKTELVAIYLQEKYGVRTANKDKMIKFTEKGKMVEEDSITLLSLLDKKLYVKNGVRLNNDYVTGEVDVYEGTEITKATKVIDIKSSWDFESFMMNILSPLNNTYWWQMQGYLWLTGAEHGEICYCLVNTPESLINDEKRRIFYAGNYATDENPEYKAKVELMEHSMRFDHVPMEERVMKFQVTRDDASIRKIQERVGECRNFLKKVGEFHKNMYIAAK